MHDFHGTFRDLLHAANLRHGTDGFTSPLKEGVLRIFSPLKIRWLRPGLNPRTWVPKASTLPLDHRNRTKKLLKKKNHIHIYVHTYMHTYIDTYIHMYIHTYIHAYIHTFTFLEGYGVTFSHDKLVQ